MAHTGKTAEKAAQLSALRALLESKINNNSLLTSEDMTVSKILEDPNIPKLLGIEVENISLSQIVVGGRGELINPDLIIGKKINLRGPASDKTTEKSKGAGLIPKLAIPLLPVPKPKEKWFQRKRRLAAEKRQAKDQEQEDAYFRHILGQIDTERLQAIKDKAKASALSPVEVQDLLTAEFIEPALRRNIGSTPHDKSQLAYSTVGNENSPRARVQPILARRLYAYLKEKDYI
jgi:hypothetical protein